jgi:hypothetical protein
MKMDGALARGCDIVCYEAKVDIEQTPDGPRVIPESYWCQLDIKLPNGEIFKAQVTEEEFDKVVKYSDETYLQTL